MGIHWSVSLRTRDELIHSAFYGHGLVVTNDDSMDHALLDIRVQPSGCRVNESCTRGVIIITSPAKETWNLKNGSCHN